MKSFFIILFLYLILPVFGQTGKIKVHVCYEADTGEAIPFAIVQIGSSETHNLIFEGATDIDGNLTSKDLLPGKYDLKVSYEFYLDYIITNQVVESGKCAYRKLKMIGLSKDSIETILYGRKGMPGYNIMTDSNWRISSKDISIKHIKKNIKLVQTIDFEDFQVKAPKNWKKLKMNGIDSYVGGLTDNTDTLHFDFGQWSNTLTDEFEKQLYAMDTINGEIGYITKPKKKHKGLLGVYFGNIERQSFNLYAYNYKNEKTIISILQSLRFNNSDTTRNSHTLKFVSVEFK